MRKLQLLLCLVLGLFLLVPGRLRGQDKAAGDDEGALEIQVVDAETKEPLPDVQLTIQQDRQNVKNRTDAQGRVWVFLPPKGPDYLMISTKADGYVPKAVRWGAWGGGGKKEKIPASYTIKLERGTEIGGVVQDEAGKPIEGAVVHMMISEGNQQGKHEYTQLNDHQATTDAQGHWKTDAMPKDISGLSMRLSHNDYISDEYYGTTKTPAAEDLRKATAVMVMKKGIEVTGVVKDAEGKPVAGASVSTGSDRWGTNFPKMKTDKDGKFRFGAVRPGQMILTVQAKGLAPELKTVNVTEKMPTVDFELQPAKTIRGKVVDAQGNPVGGAFVAADTWRGNRTIDWRVNTKADGTFEWNGAPTDEVLFDLGKQGFQSARKQKGTWEKEMLVTLRPPLKITGTAVDAETGKPIPSFRVLQGMKWDNNPTPYWQNYNVKSGENGKFVMQFDEPYPKVLVRIEAEGYLPAPSPEYTMDGGDQVFDAKLKKGTGPGGVVLLPDGTPASGAEVGLATPSAQVYIQNGKMQQFGNISIVTTQDDGKFSFMPQTDPYKIAIVHDAGFLELNEDDFKKGKEFKLQPWGRLEVTLLKGNKPWAGQNVGIQASSTYEQGKPQISFNFEAATDAEGKAVFPRVRPASQGMQVSRLITQQMGQYSTTTYVNSTPITVKPGETTKVQIGGKGRPVTGKVEIPEEDQAAAKKWVPGQAMVMEKRPDPELPDNWPDMTREEKQKWQTEFYAQQQKKSGLAYVRTYPVSLDDKGVFKIEDVEPGNYQLTYMLHEAASGQNQMYGDVRGVASKEFKVDSIPGGFTDTPLDLGTITLETSKPAPKPGEAAPVISGTTIDGKQWSTSDAKGKYLLIELFSTTWDMPAGALEGMKEIKSTYGGNDKLAIVGFVLDPKLKFVQRFQEKQKIDWPLIHIGDWRKNPMGKWNTRNFPSYWLLDPEGKIVTADADLAKIKEGLSTNVKK